MKLVPNSKPALDCPVLFPYAPNAVILGFIFTTIGSIIGMFLTPMLGLPMILPGVMSNFFAGGTAGIFANQVGGRRGTIIGSLNLSQESSKIRKQKIIIESYTGGMINVFLW